MAGVGIILVMAGTAAGANSNYSAMCRAD